MARPDGGNPLRTGIFGIALVACAGAGVVRLHPTAVLAAGQVLPGVLHRRGRDLTGQRCRRVGHQGRQGDPHRIRRQLGQGRRSPSTATSGWATSRWSRSRPTPCSARSRWRSPRTAPRKSTVIPLGRTTTPYTLNTALQDLGQNASELDKPKFEQALQTLTDTLRDATPELRGALDGVANLSRSLNKRDEALEELLAHAKKCHRHPGAAGRSDQPAHHRRQPAVRRAR